LVCGGATETGNEEKREEIARAHRAQVQHSDYRKSFLEAINHRTIYDSEKFM
jgi:hypothetical protein